MSPSRSVGVADTAPGTAVAEVDVLERASPDITTTLTADPGSAGTTWAVANGGPTSLFPQTNNFKVRSQSEVVLVTGGAGTNSWTVTRGQDGTTAAAHASGSTVAQVVGVQRVSPVSERAISYLGSVATFRTLGNAASPQNLFTLENQAGSAVLVAIRALRVEQDSTAVLTAVSNQFKLSRPSALPTGGTTLSKGSLDTALTSNASVVARGATASDGGAATAITATAGTTMWCQFGARFHTAVGQWIPDDFDLMPIAITNTDGIILRAGQAILVQVINPTAANNAATNHYTIRCAYEEFTLP